MNSIGRITGSARCLAFMAILMTCHAAEASGAVLQGQKSLNANNIYALDAQELAARIAAYDKLGVKWVRFDFDWSVIQPNDAGDFNFSGYDAAVRALAAANIRILGTIDYTPFWANGGEPSKYYPPLYVSDFAKFAATVVARYASMGVHTWEIWNEPNMGRFWNPGADPAGYTVLLQAAYVSIHAADRAAIVLTGGMADPTNSQTDLDARTFLTDMYGNGAKGYFDALSFHPYTSPDMPGNKDHNPWQQMFATNPSLLSIMSDNGDSKRIWLTEFGAPTSGDGNEVISETAQAKMILQGFKLAKSYTWAGPLFIYDLLDFHPYGYTTDPGSYFGLLRSDWTSKPSYATYRNLP